MHVDVSIDAGEVVDIGGQNIPIAATDLGIRMDAITDHRVYVDQWIAGLKGLRTKHRRYSFCRQLSICRVLQGADPRQ
jgi:hypothetical protein